MPWSRRERKLQSPHLINVGVNLFFNKTVYQLINKKKSKKNKVTKMEVALNFLNTPFFKGVCLRFICCAGANGDGAPPLFSKEKGKCQRVKKRRQYIF